MTLQAAVNFRSTSAASSSVSRRSASWPMTPVSPTNTVTSSSRPTSDTKLLKRVEQDALTLCRALGYDLNTVEFAVEDGIPYAIDFMNPVPDADLYSVGEASFRLDRRRHGAAGSQQGAISTCDRNSSKISAPLVNLAFWSQN